MNKIRTLIKKEILDILRDKKTLIIMVAVSVLLYPAIMIGMVFVMNFVLQSQKNEEHIVAYAVQDEVYIDQLDNVYQTYKDEYDFTLSFLAVNEEEKQNMTENFDVWISFQEIKEVLAITVEYTSTNQKSCYVESALHEITDTYREELLTQNLLAEGLSEDFLHPLTYEAQDSATVTESFGMSIGGSIGMLMIITIMLGAFYPAIDATTGEKERGTLETLLTLPVTNFQMIMSKFIAVSVFACMTAILSLLSLGASVLFLVNSVAAEASNEFSAFDINVIICWLPVLIIVMIVTALLVTAFSMCFCIFAKSFKEANNYLTPVMLIVMFASMVAMIPSVNLNYFTSLIPLVNVSLLIKEVISQQLNLALAGITIGINFCYSILIIWILSKMYDSENILFSDGFQRFQLFEKRSEIKKGSVPDIGDLLLSVIVLLLLVMYIGTAVSVRSVLGGMIVTQLLILTVPFLITIYMKSDHKQIYSLHLPAIKSILGGLLLYVGTFSLMLVISMALMKVFPESTKNLNQSFEGILKQPFFLVILVTTIMPAIGEELFFRGFLLGSLQNKYRMALSILISSVIFGVFHMSIVKLIPTAMLGACFAYITCKSGSIYIGMFLHCLNNLLSMITMQYPTQMENYLPILVKSQFSPVEMLGMNLVGIICLSMGICLFRLKRSENIIKKHSK